MNLSSKSYDDWLSEFRKKIGETYETMRMDKQIGHVHEVQKPAMTVPKGSGPTPLAHKLTGTELPEPYMFSIQNVTPINIGFDVNLGNWADDREFTIMDPLLCGLARDLSMRGGHSVLHSMYEKAGFKMKTEEEGKLSKMDIAKLDSWVGSQSWYADTLVIHPEQQVEFLIKNEIWLKNKIAPTSIVKKGYNYTGMLGSLDVICTPLAKDLAFVFDKEQIFVAVTPLKIDFDNMYEPHSLKIEQFISSAPIDSRAVAVALLKEKST